MKKQKQFEHQIFLNVPGQTNTTHFATRKDPIQNEQSFGLSVKEGWLLGVFSVHSSNGKGEACCDLMCFKIVRLTCPDTSAGPP